MRLWPAVIVQEIISIPQGACNIRCWQQEPASTCTFKTIYKHFHPRVTGPTFPWRILWRLKLRTRLQLFCWRLLLGKLPTKGQLAKWDSSIDPTCPLCYLAEESAGHLFASCSFAHLVWSLTPSIVQKLTILGSINQWFLHQANNEHRRLRTTLIWYIWKARN